MYRLITFTGVRPNAPTACGGDEGRPDSAVASATTQVGCASGGTHLSSKTTRCQPTNAPKRSCGGWYGWLCFTFLVTPVSALAAQAQPKSFKDFVNIILGINQTLVSLIFALTFIVLAWTIVNTWIIKGGDEAEVEKGKKVLTIGIIVLVIMSGIWGILALLRSGFFGI